MVYDVVVPVGPRNLGISLKSIRSLHLLLQPRIIFILTASRNFSFFSRHLQPEIPFRLVDEDRILDDFTFARLKNMLQDRIGSSQRAGWYFQQFLKMGFCDFPGISDYYLVWDSDTVLLKPIDFFSGTTVLINPQSEYFKPYFETLRKILGLERQVDFSFIAEHMMFNKKIMRELLTGLRKRAPTGVDWPTFIIDSIDNGNLGGAGFSEYETYGNFTIRQDPHALECRPIKSIRMASLFYGANPNQFDLASLLRLDHAYASFEAHIETSWIKLAKNKLFAVIRAMVYLASRRGRDRLHLTTRICRDAESGSGKGVEPASGGGFRVAMK